MPESDNEYEEEDGSNESCIDCAHYDGIYIITCKEHWWSCRSFRKKDPNSRIWCTFKEKPISEENIDVGHCVFFKSKVSFIPVDQPVTGTADTPDKSDSTKKTDRFASIEV
jgi:hypothetical protein